MQNEGEVMRHMLSEEDKGQRDTMCGTRGKGVVTKSEGT